MRRAVVASLLASMMLALVAACPAWSQVTAPPLLSERAEADDLFGKPSEPVKKAESFEHGVVLLLKSMSKQLDALRLEVKELRKQNEDLQDAIDFLIDEQEDEEDANPWRRLLDEIDEEMDDDDDDDDFRKWRRKRRDRHSLNQVPGIPHRTDQELERSADLLGELRAKPKLWEVYKYHQDIPAYRAAMDAYKAENQKKSEAWFDINRDMPGGA